MNNIERVLNEKGFTFDLIAKIHESCPGTFVDGLPTVVVLNCSADCDCNACWESEDSK